MEPSEIVDVMRAVMLWESQCLQQVAARLGPVEGQVVLHLQSCQGRIVLTGMGKMGHVARKAAGTFSSTGTPAFFLHPSEALHGDLGMLAANDFLIALSNSGETEEVLALLPHVISQAIPIIALTGNPKSTLADKSQFVIDIGVPHEADEISEAPTASTTVALAVCDGLAVALLRSRGFSREQFAIYHPSGFLGRKMLLRVADIMHAGERVPIAEAHCPMRNAILTMSEKGLGCIFVVDPNQVLTGILTDGDLRRALGKNANPLSDELQDHMIRNPKTIGASLLAAEALQLMERHSITVLPVVDEQGRPIGALHLHALVQAGLA